MKLKKKGISIGHFSDNRLNHKENICSVGIGMGSGGNRRCRGEGSQSVRESGEGTCEKMRFVIPSTTMSEKQTEKQKSKGGRRKKASAGTQERTLNDLKRVLDNPDKPIIPKCSANKIAKLPPLRDTTPRQMYADGGQKIDVLTYLTRRGKEVSPPNGREEVLQYLEEYMQFCGEQKIPPTLGLFAVWCGFTLQAMYNREINNKKPEEAATWTFAKEVIRGFVETAAMQNEVNPVIYFHQMKTQYGFVENKQVTVKVEDNRRELTESERQDRIAMLTDTTPVTMHEKDGVWTSEE